MRASRLLTAALSIILSTAVTSAQSISQQFMVSTASGSILVESFGSCVRSTCPAVIILSGSKGFAAPAYGDIGQMLRAAGLDAYLVHVLSTIDLRAIAMASGAQARIDFYARRLPDWTATVRRVIADLQTRPGHSGKVGVLGISLGAEIASAASVGQADIGALVLVDGGLPRGYSQPIRSLPPLLLIWGGADRTFPLSIARNLEQRAQGLGGSASLKVYEGGAHGFFLQAGNQTIGRAHRDAAEFLFSELSQ